MWLLTTWLKGLKSVLAAILKYSAEKLSKNKVMQTLLTLPVVQIERKCQSWYHQESNIQYLKDNLSVVFLISNHMSIVEKGCHRFKIQAVFAVFLRKKTTLIKFISKL